MRRARSLMNGDVQVTSAFWNERIETIRTGALPSMYIQMKDTGRWDCLKLKWKPGDPNKPHQFWDSDIAKWVEAACYILAKKHDDRLSQLVEEAVSMIRKAQWDDGYINTYFCVVEPSKRWTNIAWMHEMYCAGHLLEAAVAHHAYSGSRRLLDPLIKYMKHIDANFGPEEGKKKAYPGHEEIELALIKAFEATGEEFLANLAVYFIQERGQRREDGHYYDIEAKARGEAPRPGPGRGPPYSYHQADKPISELTSIEGHSVRAMYWLNGAAGVARITEDEQLFEDVYRLWLSTTERKMYVTGGLGAMPAWEGFGPDYYLPNETGYLETCAAVALVFFARQMLYIDPRNVQYANVMELALYNAVLVGIALDGRSFFYENPLATIGEYYARSNWFECSCCPANVARLIASIGDYIYTVDEDDTICVHLYISSTATLALASGGTVTIEQKSNGPWQGGSTFTVISNEEGSGENILVDLRVPPRTKGFRITSLSDEPMKTIHVRHVSPGLYRVSLSAGETTFKAHFDFEPVQITPHPLDLENRNCVAIARGPFIYCAETVDNEENFDDLRAIRIPEDAEFVEIPMEEKLAYFRKDEKDQEAWNAALKDAVLLRARVQREDSVAEVRGLMITLVPYFMWANRGKSDLRVWLPQA